MIIARQHGNRWLAMGILCLGALMIVLDITIVNVALPSIRADLSFSETSLAWVVNIFCLRNLSVSCLTGILRSAAMFSWFFHSALYMQRALGLTPMQIGLAFLPANIIMAVFSLGVSATLVIRFGMRRPLAAGLLIAAAGLLLFARAPLNGSLMRDVIPGMLLVGLGGGIGFNPVLMAAMSEVSHAESGLASGVVNTAFLLGGSLGLAGLASVASGRTARLTLAGTTHLEALAGGLPSCFLGELAPQEGSAESVTTS